MQAYIANKSSEDSCDQTRVQQLVAGQVKGKVHFCEVPLSNVQHMKLYSRNADQIEVATRIAKGHKLNIII